MLSLLPRLFFPRDEELELLPGAFRPRLQESLVRLGTGMPCAPAARERAWLTGVPAAPATARRLTEAAGAAQVALQDAAVAVPRQTAPDPPAGPAVHQRSAAGAMVPVVGGTWRGPQ